MKSFLQYLTESKHDYSFRIRFAGKPESGVAKNIKAALAGFGVKSVGDVKSHVVERSHPMFPGLANPEVYSVDVVCEYPATAFQIRKSLLQRLQVISGIATSVVSLAVCPRCTCRTLKRNTPLRE